MSEEIKLPEPVFLSVRRGGLLREDAYTAEQMREYGRQCAEAERAKAINDTYIELAELFERKVAKYRARIPGDPLVAMRARALIDGIEIAAAAIRSGVDEPTKRKDEWEAVRAQGAEDCVVAIDEYISARSKT